MLNFLKKCLSDFHKKHRVLSIFIFTLIIIVIVLGVISLIGRIIIHKDPSFRLYLLEQGELSSEQVISYLHEAATMKKPKSADNHLLSNLLTECKRRNIRIEKKELIPLLNHPAQTVRYQAVLHLGAQIDSRNVSSLIKALDMPFEKSHHAIMSLLRETTREELPDDPQIWKEWYKKLPDTSEFKQMQY